MAVPVRLGPDLILGQPRQVLKWAHGIVSNDGRHYDVSPDGKRFLLLKDVEDAKALEQKILVVEHWGDELKAKFDR